LAILFFTTVCDRETQIEAKKKKELATFQAIVSKCLEAIILKKTESFLTISRNFLKKKEN
jgi:hypothetical protein